MPLDSAIPRPASPYERHVCKLSPVLRRALLNSSGQIKAEISFRSGARFELLWFATGRTSGVGFWFCKKRIMLMITVLCSGLDATEDQAAIKFAMSVMPCAFSEEAAEAIAKVPHPVMACVHRTSATVLDVRTSSALVSLAVAFFGSLGVGEYEKLGGFVLE